MNYLEIWLMREDNIVYIRPTGRMFLQTSSSHLISATMTPTPVEDQANLAQDIILFQTTRLNQQKRKPHINHNYEVQTHKKQKRKPHVMKTMHGGNQRQVLFLYE